MTKYEMLQIVLTAFILTAAIIAACIYGCQLSEMQKATIAATKASNAAEKAAKTAQDTLLITQRPFVFVAIFDIHIIGEEIRILPKWKNSGSTPAMQFRNWANWKIFPNGPPHGYTWPDLDASGKPLPIPDNGTITFIGPKATIYAESLKIPISTMEQVRAGKQRLFLWGWSEYNDILGGTPRHRTEFCNEVTVTDLGKDSKGEATIAASFAHHRTHNTAN